MFCYYCIEHGREIQAVALCRWCGAAVCCDHVVEVRSASEPAALLAPLLPPRRELVCQFCWEAHFQAAITTPRRQMDLREDTLPEVTDAVQFAEAFLSGNYNPRQRPLRGRLKALRSMVIAGLRHIRLTTAQSPD